MVAPCAALKERIVSYFRNRGIEEAGLEEKVIKRICYHNTDILKLDMLNNNFARRGLSTVLQNMDVFAAAPQDDLPEQALARQMFDALMMEWKGLEKKNKIFRQGTSAGRG